MGELAEEGFAIGVHSSNGLRWIKGVRRRSRDSKRSWQLVIRVPICDHSMLKSDINQFAMFPDCDVQRNEMKSYQEISCDGCKDGTLSDRDSIDDWAADAESGDCGRRVWVRGCLKVWMSDAAWRDTSTGSLKLPQARCQMIPDCGRPRDRLVDRDRPAWDNICCGL